MEMKYEKYPFTPILGWSGSRYEVFDKCKRQYYYSYYANFVDDVPAYKLKMLKALTSVALEIGNVIHDVMEALLKRLQVSDSTIDEQKFIAYAHTRAREYFSQKTFLEVYYKQKQCIVMEEALQKIDVCLKNLLSGPIFNWLFMKAMYNKNNWMIEPSGYGETRLNGLKAYCKMDFLFPVDDDIYIFDWKTGKKDIFKHSNQLIAYAAAASNNFHLSWKRIVPRIVYLYPEFDELEIALTGETIDIFLHKVQEQTSHLYDFCSDVKRNLPHPIVQFIKTPSPGMCRFCNYQELCFPEGLAMEAGSIKEELVVE
jgi:hypothetical protein